MPDRSRRVAKCACRIRTVLHIGRTSAAPATRRWARVPRERRSDIRNRSFEPRTWQRGARWKFSLTRSFPQVSTSCGSLIVVARPARAGQSTGSDRSTNHAGCANRADSAGERSTADCERSIQWRVTAAPLARGGNASSCCRASFGASAPERNPATNPCRTVG